MVYQLQSHHIEKHSSEIPGTRSTQILLLRLSRQVYPMDKSGSFQELRNNKHLGAIKKCICYYVNQ
jgi:hypothetical protein